MDRRSIIFMLIMIFSFFGMNYWFDIKRVEELQAEKQKQLVLEQQYAEKVKNSLIPIESLPLVDLYEDAQGSRVLGKALLLESVAYTTSSRSFPETVYVKQHNNFVPLQLISDLEIAVFAPSKQTPLPTVKLPSVGSLPIQFLEFSKEVRTYLGEYENGQFFFAKQIPDSPLLTFIRYGQKVYCLGVYNPKAQEMHYLFAQKSLVNNIQFTDTIPPFKGKESFYTLSSPYQQVVFSSIGGSIAEINLPLASNTAESVVRKTHLDTIFASRYKANDIFPLHPSVEKVGAKLSRTPSKQGGFYPLLRRGIVMTTKEASLQLQPQYYALSILDPSMKEIPFQMKSISDRSIVFEGVIKSTTIKKTYSLPEDPSKAPYLINCTIEVSGDAENLWITTGVPEVELVSGVSSPFLQYRSIQNGKAIVNKIDLPKNVETLSDTKARWVSSSNGYFALIIHANSPFGQIKTNMVPGDLAPSRLSVVDSRYDRYPVDEYPGYEALVPITEKVTKLQFYAGPIDSAILAQVDSSFPADENPDFSSVVAYYGMLAFITEPFSKLLMLLLNLFHAITQSWGFSIILLTAVLRIMLYPLNAWFIRSQANSSLVSPKIEAIKERYKNDPQKMRMEIMNVYKKHGGNPFIGCLPMLIQLPFLFGMIDLLKTSFELRGASFIPGWITNLAAPDILFSWSRPLPVIGNSFHLLPFITAIVMFASTKLMSSANKVKLTEEQKQQQKIATYANFIFLFFFYNLPSGVNIYWIASSFFGMLQQWITVKNKKSV